MKTIDTLRDIVTEFAPEYLDQIAERYIVETNYHASNQYGPCTTTLRDDWTTNAFDTLGEAMTFIAQRTAEIREDVKSYLNPRDDITYTVSFGYKKVPCIVVESGTDIDLDLGSADILDGSGRVAYYSYDEFLDKPDSIEYNNYEESGRDPIYNPYYLPTSAYWDTAFADSEPVCVDRKEAERLYSDWYGEYGANYDDTTEFDDLWREADEDEIAEYGTYDS